MGETYASPDQVPQDKSRLSQYEMQELLAIDTEVQNRRLESLKLYEPLSFQDAFHACTAKECILQKGNQVGGAQPLDSQVLTPMGWVDMGSLSVGDKIIGGDGNPHEVTGVFPQGWKPIFELTFDDGATTVCTECHYWRCKLKKSEKWGKGRLSNKWGVYTLEEIREYAGDDPLPRERMAVPLAVSQFKSRPVPVEPYTLGVLLGDGSISQSSVTFTTEDAEIYQEVAAESVANVKCVKRTPNKDNGNADLYAITRDASLGPNLVMDGLREIGVMGCKSEHKFIPREYIENSIECRVALLQGLMDTDGTCGKKNHVTEFFTCSVRLASDVIDLVRSLGGKAWVSWKETSITIRQKKRGRPPKGLPRSSRKKCLAMACVKIVLADFCPFRLKRKAERWAKRQDAHANHRRLISIRLIGNAPTQCIAVSTPDQTYITDNYIVTHNSLSGFVEVARAITGQDPYDKYPKENGVAVCLGYGEKHIGRVIHKYLFRAGAFKIIRDLETGQWRTFRPWSSTVEVDGKRGDEERKEEAKPAPPLIPPRFIDGKISYEKRSEHVFSYAKFITGWELYALNSAGDPSQAQGFQADLYHIDEDVAAPGWHEEAIGRTMTREGKIRWTALPHAKTEDIMNMIGRAISEEEHGVPVEERNTVRIKATIYDNPYLPEESRKASEKIWRDQGEDTFRKRAMGEIVIDHILMYPTFNRKLHDAINWDEDDRNKAQAILTKRNGEPSLEWTKYMVVDPGHTVCAVTFWCVPPPDVGDYRICYDELYMRNCDKHIFGRNVKVKTQDKQFQDFIIDAHGGRLRELGSGILPKKQYESEMEKLDIKCIERGHRFMPGSDDVHGREEKLREWLSLRPDSTTKFMVVASKCPNLIREIERFKKKTVRVGGQDIPTDEGNRRANTHSVETAEYAAAHGLPYVKPTQVVVTSTYVKWLKKQRADRSKIRAARHYDPSRGTRSLSPRGASPASA